MTVRDEDGFLAQMQRDIEGKRRLAGGQHGDDTRARRIAKTLEMLAGG